jgi:hypothetical protein
MKFGVCFVHMIYEFKLLAELLSQEPYLADDKIAFCGHYCSCVRALKDCARARARRRWGHFFRSL